MTARGGDVQLTLPAGAVAADQPITVSTLSSPPQSSRVVGNALSFTSTTFSAPIRLRIAYNPSKIPSGSAAGDLSIYKLVGGTWTRQPSVVDPAAHTVTALVSSFSDYGVLTPTSSPVVAEATLDANSGLPAVSVSWDASAFSKGDGIARWQVYRSDVSAFPVLVMNGTRSEAVDSSIQDDSDYPNEYLVSEPGENPTGCQNTSPANTSRTSPPLVSAGRPYVYSLNAVYEILNGGTGSTSGDTQACYFQTVRPTSGKATPLSRPTLGTVSGASSTRTFTIVDNDATSTFSPEFVLEFSDSAAFPSAATVRTDPFSALAVSVDINGALFDHAGSSGTNLRAVATLFYRVGVRNATDEPGPVKDALSGLRYIYSLPSTFTRSGVSP